MSGANKPLVWIKSEVKTPPFSFEARIQAGRLLRRLQRGDRLAMPHSRPMSVVGPRCHELRIMDAGKNWRIIHRVDTDAVVIAYVFTKTTRTTPPRMIDASRRRLREYDAAAREERRHEAQ